MSYSLPQNGAQQVSLQQAIDMTERFRENKATILNQGYSNVLCISETYNLGDIRTLLDTPGIEALRIYNGMDSSFNVKSILVAVDLEGNDLLPQDPPSPGDPIIVNSGVRCPPACPNSSPLNT